MKKLLVVFVIMFALSIPTHAFIPEFGLKIGYDKQSFEDMGVITPDIYSDSLSTWWPWAKRRSKLCF